MSSPSVASEVVAYLRAAYPSLEPTPELLLVWDDILKEFPRDLVLHAAREYIRAGNEYPPNLGALVATIKRIQFRLVPPTPAPRARLIYSQDPKAIAPPHQ